MKGLVVLVVVLTISMVPFGNNAVLGNYSGLNIGDGSLAKDPVSDSTAVESAWTKYEAEFFVDTFVYPIFRDPGYYPGSDVKMGTFAILMGCTGNCAEWISHVIEVDSITPEYMCGWLYEYGFKLDYGRHLNVGGEVIEVLSREDYVRHLNDLLGTDKKPNCRQFLID